jgi:hypothetical protein
MENVVGRSKDGRFIFRKAKGLEVEIVEHDSGTRFLPVLRRGFAVDGLARKNHAKSEATNSLRARKLLIRR